MNYITRWINHQSTEHDMTWNNRSKYAIEKNKVSLLVYMTDADKWNPSKDIYVKLMEGANGYMRGKSFQLLPIIAHYDAQYESDLEPLQDILGINKTDLPSFFMVHGDSLSVVKYPDSLDDWTDFIPELLVIWGNVELLGKEIPRLRSNIEITQDVREKDQFKKLLDKSEKDFDLLMKKLIELKGQLANPEMKAKQKKGRKEAEARAEAARAEANKSKDEL